MIISSSLAQEKPWEFEVFTGINLSQIKDFDPYVLSEHYNYKSKPRASVVLGFQTSYFITKSFGFKTGLLLSPRGGSYSKDSPNVININTGGTGGSNQGKDIHTYKTNYLDIPLLITFRTKGEQPFTFEMGYSFSLLMSSSFKYNEYSFSGNGFLTDAKESWQEEDLEGVNDTAGNIVIGLNTSFEMPNSLSTSRILVGLRYSIGVTDVFEYDTINGYDASVQSNSLTIKLGFLLN
ncbi:MAG: PorT family protein [Flavobacteriaceae bacterium]|nr:PorT family protein [Flavobacteriaceae bacterium]